MLTWNFFVNFMAEISNILDGKSLALTVIDDIKNKIYSCTVKNSLRIPKLVVVQVGNDPASSSYIKQKQTMSLKAGMKFELIQLASTITETELLTTIKALNDNQGVDGFLVQLPLPKHICPSKIVAHILPTKDVDGFHPENMGNIFYRKHDLAPCTPLGILLLLENYKVELIGKNIVIVGASTIVGQPLATMLTNAGATVTLCHKLTNNLPKIVNNSDIIISATGNTKAVDANDIKQNAIVIDVGINFTANGRIIGDLDATIIKKRASLYTPVPGGVGPMTVAALLLNTWHAYLANMSAK